MSTHYFTDHAPATAEQRREMRVRLAGQMRSVYVADGVFSTKGLDKATAILLDVAPRPRGLVADLGCGWGPISLDIALGNPDTRVWALDVNSRALDLTRLNAARLGAESIEVKEATAALAYAQREGVRFDAIRSNPPVRIGKNEVRALMEAWCALLCDDGEATFVMSRHLGADSLAAYLSKRGFDVERLASKQGFRVIQLRRGR